MLTKQIIESNLANSSSPVKLKRSFIIDIVNGKIKVEASTIDLLLCTSLYVDIDLKLNITLAKLRSVLNMREDTFKFAFNQAVSLGLIEQSTHNHLKSTIHTNIDGSEQDYIYIPNLSIFQSPDFRNLNLNQKKLFLYFVSATMPGYHFKVAAKNLYTNSLHDPAAGINFFTNYRDAIDALIKLTNLGMIQVSIQVNSIKEKIENTDNTLDFNCAALLKEQLQMPTEKSRKKWLSIATKKNINFGIRVLTTNIEKVSSSFTELALLADSNNMPIDLIDCKEQLYFILGYKNQLLKELGIETITLYRNELKRYFNDKGHLLDYYVSKGKFANYFKDFYLDPAVQKDLLKKIENLNQLNLSQRTLSKIQITKQINYLKKSLSKESLMLLNVQIQKLIKTSNSDIYAIHELNETVDFNILQEYNSFLEETNMKTTLEAFKENYFIQCQQQHVFIAEQFVDIIKNQLDLKNLTRQKLIILEKIKLLLNPQPKKAPKKAPLYNWLEERD